MRTIILITSRFPYLPGEEFLEAELPYLAAEFDRVVVMPNTVSGTPRGVPPRVEIETGLASAPSSRVLPKLIRLARHPLLYANAVIRGISKPFRLRQTISTASGVAAWQEWFSEYLSQRITESEFVLVYLYWTTSAILGVRLASRGRHGVVGIVSRCHGFDLYVKERGDSNWPFHEQLLRSVDRLFPVSEHGRKYMISHYPWIESKVEVKRLGVIDYGPCNAIPCPGTITVCSCSNMIILKRIDMLICALASIGRDFPETRIEWHHFGAGPLRSELEQLANSYFTANVIRSFHGQVSNARVREFYREQWIDVFVNTSAAEGAPVSIMEAQCAGIPVIATAVGGTPELVNGENGMLLPSNPDVEEVAAAIGGVIREPACWFEKRKASRQTWQTLSNADNNYRNFVQRLSQLFERQEPHCP